MKLYSQIELFEETGIPERTWAQWRYLGKGPRYLKLGRHVRYRGDDIESWMQTRSFNHDDDS